MKRWWQIALVCIAVGAGVALWMARQPTSTTPGILVVSGRVEGDQAAVGAKVAGKIAHLAVHEGARVKADALIAELTSDQLQAQLQHAEHTLHTAREQLVAAQARVVSIERQVAEAQIAVKLAERESQARIGEAQAALEAARAQLRQAIADFDLASKDYTRYQSLFAKKVIAAQQLDQAETAADVAQAGVEAARKRVSQAEKTLELAQTSQVTVEYRRQEVQTTRGQLDEARAAVEIARARMQTAEASMQLAQANLRDTRVTAPFTGTVLRKLVEPGEVVAAGTPLITLVDLANLHAKVYVAEKDLGKVKVGDAARVYSDTFPTQYFEAAVSQVAQQAEFTPRDIHMRDERVKLVFAIKLAIDNPRGVLKPGMPVDARIRWDPQANWSDGMD